MHCWMHAGMHLTIVQRRYNYYHYCLLKYTLFTRANKQRLRFTSLLIAYYEYFFVLKYYFPIVGLMRFLTQTQFKILGQ